MKRRRDMLRADAVRTLHWPGGAVYLDLERPRLPAETIGRLRPWGGNLGKRLVKSPKVYVRDSGLSHGLLELETLNDLQIAQRYVVYPGLERIPLRHGATAIGLQELVALLGQ